MLSEWITEWRGMAHRGLGVLPFTRHTPCNRAAKRQNTGIGIVLKCVECGAQQQLAPDDVHVPASNAFYYWCEVLELPRGIKVT